MEWAAVVGLGGVSAQEEGQLGSLRGSTRAREALARLRGQRQGPGGGRLEDSPTLQSPQVQG